MTTEELKDQLRSFDARSVLAKADIEEGLRKMLQARNHFTMARVNDPNGTNGKMAEIIARGLTEPIATTQTFLVASEVSRE